MPAARDPRATFPHERQSDGSQHMVTKVETRKWQRAYLNLFRKAGIVLTSREQRALETADFGLGEMDRIGLGLVVYVNTERCCAKELALLPYQTCPEHRHPPTGAGSPGKEETFRCRWGKVRLYVPGRRAARIKARLPRGRESFFTVWREIELNPGDQYTLKPDTLHWFQAGAAGAVISEFSTKSTDENDCFTDPGIRR